MTINHFTKFMTKQLSILTIGATVLFSGLAQAGDDPVNCRTETSHDQAIYSGFSQCSAFYTDANGFPRSRFITSYVPPTTSNRVQLREFVYDTNFPTFVSCFAIVPFSHFETVNVQVCDYTPKVSISSSNNFNSATVRANASDRDGSIAGYEWWVDGTKLSSTGSQITLQGNGGFTTYNVRVTVTDNDGYTDTSTRNVRVGFEEPPCGGFGQPICP